MIRIDKIATWPVKGLGPLFLERVSLEKGEALPSDRAYAIARGAAMERGGDVADLGWRDCIQLKNCPKLAALETEFDLDEQVLTLKRQGRQVARGNLSQPIGRTLIEQFLTAYLGDDLQSPPRIVTAPGTTFSDAKQPLLSIINLETLRDIERVARAPVDHRRMRGNLYIDGPDAWAEFDWIGQEFSIGAARLRIVARIDRCAATNVDPDTGERDMQIPKVLQSGFGHMDCGVFAEVIEGGEIAEGDEFAN
ncbi:MOSC domain-containing protein [Minwuia sp.]|uniref:MOSC domain-containing protein n=1 Tax=Minwuia sp. TaxID=2493630 RepID=UPI003A93D8FC